MTAQHLVTKLKDKLHIGSSESRTKRVERAPTSPVSTHDPLKAEAHQQQKQQAVQEVESPNVRYREGLKCLLITWNMHDNVPHGDLSDLLGVLPPHDAPIPRGETEDALPTLAHCDEHFFHVIVVCGQEAPGGARWTERLEDYYVKGHTGAYRDPDLPHSPVHSDSMTDLDLPTPKLGSASLPDEQKTHTGLSPALPMIRTSETMPTPTHVKSDNTSPIMRQRSSHYKPSRGPYVLVSKERLMGIYICCFALRTVEHLITAHDKATVTAGLLGGRVGNKGCAAISMHIAKTRLLFISAHLAAHQEGQNLRKENVLKIRDELYIDDFGGRHKTHADPHKRRDVSENFDCVFFCGDLNYRVDVSRLHADWLVRMQDWRNALQFDQLKAIMAKGGTCWDHWREGEIDFPPTYKYDLIKLDHHRRHTLQRQTSLRHLPSGKRRKRAETNSAVPSGASTPLPPAAENGLHIELSPRGSVSSLHDALVNGELADRLSSSDAQDLRTKLAQTMTSGSSSSLEVPGRHDSRSSDGDEELPSLSKAGTERGSVSSVITQILDPDATYDTSKKQRVQSWCDRILWRSNIMTPTPEPKKSRRLSVGSPSRARSASPAKADNEERRMSLPRRFPHRGGAERRQASDATIKGSPHSDTESPKTSPDLANGHADARHRTSPERPSTKLQVTIEEESTFKGLRPRSRSETTSASDEVKRKPGFALLPTFTLEPNKTNDPTDTRRGSVIAGWRQWLLGSSQSSATPARPPSPTPAPQQVLGPKRGEVEVLQYTSVNDLRKMEALSDHRPVRAVLVLGLSDE